MPKLTAHTKHLPHHKIGPVKFGLIITSDTRIPQTDQTGQTIIKLMKRKGHSCISHRIIKNKVSLIRNEVKRLLNSERAQLVITSGGTGCGKRDITIEAINPLLVKQLEGFGELFRAFSLKEIGSAALMSRARLGVTRKGQIICALPGSANAARLALTKLLLPELEHLIWETNR